MRMISCTGDSRRQSLLLSGDIFPLRSIDEDDFYAKFVFIAGPKACPVTGKVLSAAKRKGFPASFAKPALCVNSDSRPLPALRATFPKGTARVCACSPLILKSSA